MAEKMSQAEIDALIAALQSGEIPLEEAASPAAAAQPAPAAPDASIDQSSIDALVQGLSSTEPTATIDQSSIDALVMGLSVPEPVAPAAHELVDLGPITQAEVEAAMAEGQLKKEAMRQEMAAAFEALHTSAPVPGAAPQAAPQPVAPNFPQMEATPMPVGNASLLMDIKLALTVVLGRARMPLRQVLTLGPGSVIVLDSLANRPVEVMVDSKPLMKADVVLIAENYGIKVVEKVLDQRKAS